MTECFACGAPTTGLYLCRADTDTLTDTLHALPAWLRHLTEAATGQARLGGNTGHRRTDETPLRVNLRASDLLHEINNRLTTWIRHLCQTRGITAPPSNTTQQCRWLAANTSAIATNPAADKIHNQITKWPKRIETMIDRPQPKWLCGPCPTIIEHNGAKKPCNLELHANDPDGTVTCPRCKTQHKARLLRQSLILRARYLPMTRTELLHALTELEEPLPKQTFSRWTLPDKSGIIRIRAHGTHPHTGEPTYWLDDVRRIARRDYDTTHRKRRTITPV